MSGLAQIGIQTETENSFSNGIKAGLFGRTSMPSVSSAVKNVPSTIVIDKLLKYNLSEPLIFTLEPDADGFIAKCPDLPTLYGYGDDKTEAINNLKFEIASLYEDLSEDDNFTEDWLK